LFAKKEANERKFSFIYDQYPIIWHLNRRSLKRKYISHENQIRENNKISFLFFFVFDFLTPHAAEGY